MNVISFSGVVSETFCDKTSGPKTCTNGYVPLERRKQAKQGRTRAKGCPMEKSRFADKRDRLIKGSTRGAKPRALFCSLLLSPTFDASFSLFSRLSLSSSIMAMRLSLFTALATNLFLVSIPSSTAQDSGGLSPDQQCLLNCSLTAVTASGCDVCVPFQLSIRYLPLTFPFYQQSRYAVYLWLVRLREQRHAVRGKHVQRPGERRHRLPGRWMRGWYECHSHRNFVR